jgi:hypothetical protein
MVSETLSSLWEFWGFHGGEDYNSGLWYRVVMLQNTDVSDGLSASIFRVKVAAEGLRLKG